MSASVLALNHLSKHFGPVAALREVDFSLEAGEVHALLGENGAGKSTLLQIAYGLVAPDGGTIAVRGTRAVLDSPRDARALGIGMVHQNFTSIPELTVRENVALAIGRRGNRSAGRQDGRTAGWSGGLADTFLRGLGPEARVRELTVAARQRLEIAKALATGADILLLDEPSAALTPDEVDSLLAEIRAYARRGGAVAFVTHKLGEVFAVADRVTVLRHGAVSLRSAVPGLTQAALTEAMLGAAAQSAESEARPERQVPRAELKVALVSIGSITIRPGDLIGIAAIEGQGQREILRRIAGLSESGRGGRQSETEISVAGTVVLIPEDRTSEGLIPELSIAENLLLGREADPRWSIGAWIRWSAVRERATEVMELYRIRAPGPSTPAGHLSGGNQQKLMLGRALEQAPHVLVAENPTRGLDIRATAEIHERLRTAARDGMAVLIYSTDLDEVLALADRVLVVRGGQMTEAPRGADRHEVGRMMLGEKVRSEK